MSRHTYVRNMNVDEEYEDDEYAYGSSYGTSYTGLFLYRKGFVGELGVF